MIKHLPNFLTSLNLLAGCLGIYFVLGNGQFEAIYFVLIGAFFDLTDGLVARLLQVSSDIGKQLDSLADLITFGVLPSFYLVKLAEAQTVYFWFPMMVAIFSALRLAKFNIDESQSDHFRGLPTPANAIMITSIPFLTFELNVWAILALTIVSCFLLVSNMKMLALKFKKFEWGGNELKWSLIVLVLVLFFVFKWTFIPYLIPIYIGFSLISYFEKAKQ